MPAPVALPVRGHHMKSTPFILLPGCTLEWYIDTGRSSASSSFRGEWLRAFFVEDRQSRTIPPDLESRLSRKLQMIDDAANRPGFESAAQQSLRETSR